MNSKDEKQNQKEAVVPGELVWAEDDPVVSVTLTTLFYSRVTVREAVKYCASPEFATYAWANLVFAAAEQGEVKARSTNLANIVRMALSKTETSGMLALKKVGAITVTALSASAKPILQGLDEKFENFWGQYPRRNGVRQGKAAAKTVFTKIILSDEDLEQVMEALANYKTICGEFPKDAERFLKNWTDYLVS